MNHDRRPKRQATVIRKRARERPGADSRRDLISEMARRIVARFHPEKIILFGSHARGDPGPDSDVDLLVVMPVEGSRRDKVIEIGVALHDIRASMDIFVTTPEDFQWRKDVIGTLEWPATHEGRTLYARS